nr:probable G-protein coupled receptor Mth-like 3 [Cherax quadricarinatus]
MIVLVTVVWMIMSIIGLGSTTSIKYSQQAEGWKCCMDSQPSACSVNKQESNFTPPIFNSNLSEAWTGLVSWTPHSLQCPWGFEITYYNLTKLNKLILEEDTIKLEWLDIILFKKTTDFCVERLPKEIYRAAVCQPRLNTICNNSTCVIKCCDPQEAEIQSVGCLSSNISLDYKSISGSPADSPTDQVVISSVPPCGSIVFRYSYEYYLLTDGSLYEPETSITYDSNSYCLATKYQENFGAFVCPRLPSEIATVKDYFQTVGVMISAIFLTLTITFHIFIPSLRDMQGLCFLCHMSSLLVADLSLFTAYVYTPQLSKIHCFIHGIILQYSFLAVFFWLNVMCLDIWRVIK